MRIKLPLDLDRPAHRRALRVLIDALDEDSPRKTPPPAPLVVDWDAVRRFSGPAAATMFGPSEPHPADLGTLAAAAAATGAAGYGAAPDVTGREQSAGEEAETPPPAAVAVERGGVTAPVSADHENGTDDGACGERAQVEVLPKSTVDIEHEDPGPVPIESDEAPLPPLPDVEPAPAEPPAPVDVIDVADLDPERPWTDEMKREAWRLHDQEGLSSLQVSRSLAIRFERVAPLLSAYRNGQKKPPELVATGGALVPVAPAGAVAIRADGSRQPAQDPAVVEEWREQCLDGERAHFIKRDLYPQAEP